MFGVSASGHTGESFYSGRLLYFFESFHQQKFQELTGIKTQFVQDNQSMSQRGVLRGLHFQTGKFVQSKLVRVIKGSVLDVAVDLRRTSKTYGKWHPVVLDSTMNNSFLGMNSAKPKFKKDPKKLSIRNLMDSMGNSPSKKEQS